jgi:DNA-binding PadR family transcriptional regulator
VKLGTVQLSVLESIAESGRWYRGCGWLWDTHSNTERVLKSLVRRGLVAIEFKQYVITEAGRQFLERRQS